jgi:hypothetical protein
VTTRVIVVIALLVAGPAAGKTPKVSPDVVAENLINDGWKLFLAGDLDAARAKFQAAHDLVPKKAQPYRLLGLTDARLHHCKEAVVSLNEFISRIKPDDPRYTEAITVRDECRVEPELAPGTLIVASVPDGAEVHVDDEKRAFPHVTPYRDDTIPSGAHTVRLVKTGFAEVVQSILIQPKTIVRIDAELTPPGKPAHPPVVSNSENPPTVATTPPPSIIAPPPPTEPTPAPSHRRAGIIAGVVVGALVVIGVAVGLGIGLTRPTETPYETAPLFPPVKGM